MSLEFDTGLSKAAFSKGNKKVQRALGVGLGKAIQMEALKALDKVLPAIKAAEETPPAETSDKSIKDIVGEVVNMYPELIGVAEKWAEKRLTRTTKFPQSAQKDNSGESSVEETPSQDIGGSQSRRSSDPVQRVIDAAVARSAGKMLIEQEVHQLRLDIAAMKQKPINSEPEKVAALTWPITREFLVVGEKPDTVERHIRIEWPGVMEQDICLQTLPTGIRIHMKGPPTGKGDPDQEFDKTYTSSQSHMELRLDKCAWIGEHGIMLVVLEESTPKMLRFSGGSLFSMSKEANLRMTSHPNPGEGHKPPRAQAEVSGRVLPAMPGECP